jgi:hypothetical protein
MPSYPKGLVILGLAVFLLGLALYLLRPPTAEDPPVLTERSHRSQTPVSDPATSVTALSGPWFRQTHTMNSAPPRPAPPPGPSDTTSVIFLGSSVDQLGTPTFFFKNTISGEVILLSPGETKRKWTLKTVGDRAFTVLGPGGVYEVTR